MKKALYMQRIGRIERRTWLERKTGLTIAELWLCMLAGAMLWLAMGILYIALAGMAAMAGAM